MSIAPDAIASSDGASASAVPSGLPITSAMKAISAASVNSASERQERVLEPVRFRLVTGLHDALVEVRLHAGDLGDDGPDDGDQSGRPEGGHAVDVGRGELLRRLHLTERRRYAGDLVIEVVDRHDQLL